MATTPYVDPNTVHNPTTGGEPPAAWGDTVRDGLEFLIDPPRCKAIRSSAVQVIPTSTWTTVTFPDADAWDTDAFHTPTESELTVPTGLGGIYLALAVLQLDDSPTGNRAARFLVNGSQIFGSTAVESADTLGAKTAITCTEEIELLDGDIIELQVYHQRTVDLDLDWARFSLRFVARN